MYDNPICLFTASNNVSNLFMKEIYYLLAKCSFMNGNNRDAVAIFVEMMNYINNINPTFEQFLNHKTITELIIALKHTPIQKDNNLFIFYNIFLSILKNYVRDKQIK